MDTTEHSAGSEPSKPAKFEILAWVLILLACSQVGYVGHPRYGPFIAAADVFCALLVLLWIGRVVHEGRLKSVRWPPAPVWMWLIVAFLSVLMAAMGRTGGIDRATIKEGGIEISQIVLYFFAAYMVFVDILNSVRKLRRALIVLLAGATIVVIWGLVDYFFQQDPVQVSAGFDSRNIYSAFLVMTIPLLFGLGSFDRWRPLRVWVGLVVIGALATMLGPPHVFIMGILLGWVGYMVGRQQRFRFAIGIVAATLVVTVILPRNRAANIGELFNPYETGKIYKIDAETDAPASPSEKSDRTLIIKKRWLKWQPSLNMMIENFPLGVGAGNYQRSIGQAAYYGNLPNVKKGERDTENFYLVIGASMGFAGLVAVIATLAWFWRRACSLWLRAETPVHRALATGLPAAVMGIAMANIFTNMFVRGVSILWAMVFAMITVATRESIVAARQRAANQSDEQSHGSDRP